MFFDLETEERLEAIRSLFRRYDDHGERAYRRHVVCQVLDLVTPDEMSSLKRIDRGILDLFYKKQMSSNQVAAAFSLRESDVSAYKTRAIKALRGIVDAPRNDWHRLKVSKQGDVAAAGESVVQDDSAHVTPMVDAIPLTLEQLWQEYDLTCSHNEHRRILATIFAGLSEDQISQIPARELDVLHPYFAGTSDKDIGKHLGFSKPTIALRKARARDRLRVISLGLTVTIAAEEQVAVISAEETKSDTEQRNSEFVALWQEYADASAYTNRRRLLAQAFAAITANELATFAASQIVALTLYSRGCTDDQIASTLQCAKQNARGIKQSAIDRLKALTLGEEIGNVTATPPEPAVEKSQDAASRKSASDPTPISRNTARNSRKHKVGDPEVAGSEPRSADESEISGEDEIVASRIPSVLKIRKFKSQERLEAVSAFCADRANQRLKRRLVETHLSIVSAIAYKYLRSVGRLSEFEDLISLGVIGLLKAAEKFDSDKKGAAKFETFAQYYIKGEILDGFQRESDKGSELRSEQILLRKERKEGLTQAEQDRLEHLQQFIWGSLDLDVPLSDDSALPLSDMLMDTHGTPEQILIEQESRDEALARRAEIHDSIAVAINELPTKERVVIELRLIAGKTILEIAFHLKVSEVWTYHLYKKALQTVQAKVKAYGLSPLD